MTTVTLNTEDLTIVITDEHATSSYGIPVAIFHGEAYGPMDHIPTIPSTDELSWLNDVSVAKTDVAAAVSSMRKAGNPLSEEDYEFVRKFWDV